MKENVLFLDIDGVLISSRSRLAQATYPAFDPVSCGLVEMVTQHCCAEIVICSAWRENRSRYEMETILSTVGISSERLHSDWATPVLDGQRSKEIKAWLEAHPETVRYAVLDDDADKRDLFPHLVQPNPDLGVTLEHIIEICALFEVPFEPLFIHREVKPAREDRVLYDQCKQRLGL